jgi:NTE family protein
MNGDLASRPQSFLAEESLEANQTTNQSEWLRWLAYGLPRGMTAESGKTNKDETKVERDRPGYVDVIGESFFIIQDFVSRVRLAADPVDLLIAPDVAHIGVMEFHRGEEAIEAGRKAVTSAQDAILRAAQTAQLKAADPI